MLRFVLIVIWSLLYFYSTSRFIYEKWSLPVFKLGQWKKLLTSWLNEQWIIDTMNEYTLVTVLILWIPVWLVGVFFVFRLTRNKKQEIVRQATASHPFIPAYTPMQMPSQGKSAQLDPLPPVQNSVPEQSLNPSVPQNMEVPTQENVKMDYVPKHQGEAQALEEITEIAQENNLTPFPHVLLENVLIPITISSDADAMLIKVLADPGIWQVPMTEPLETGIWMNNGQNKVVLKEIVLGKEILKKMEPDSIVTPVVVLAQGSLANSETVLPWLNQHGIEVVTLPNNPQNGLPHLGDIIEKYFPLSENEESDEEQQEQLNEQIQTTSI